MLTGSESSTDEARYGARAAFAWRASYARCLDKGEHAVCVEVPVDGIPVAQIVSPNPAAPRSYSTIAWTPGLRFQSNEYPLGFLPLNFIALGVGAAHYASSDARIDGAPAPRQRATTLAIRVDLGLSVRLSDRLGLRIGVFGVGSEEPEWFQRLGVLPAGARLSGDRIGGYGALYLRR